MKRIKKSMNMILCMAQAKEQNRKEAAELPYMREGILTGLLIDVAEVFDVPLKLIQSGDRQELTVIVRSIFYHVARCKTEFGLKQFVKTAGKKEHTSAINLLRNVEGYFKDNNSEFITLWNHYLAHSKLFTPKDFNNGKN